MKHAVSFPFTVQEHDRVCPGKQPAWGFLVRVSDQKLQEEDQKRREARQAAKKQQQQLLQQRQQQLAQMNAGAAMPQQPGAPAVARDGQIRGVIRSSGKWNTAANQQ